MVLDMLSHKDSSLQLGGRLLQHWQYWNFLRGLTLTRC